MFEIFESDRLSCQPPIRANVSWISFSYLINFWVQREKGEEALQKKKGVRRETLALHVF